MLQGLGYTQSTVPVKKDNSTTLAYSSFTLKEK